MNFTQDDIDMNHLWYFHTNILVPESHDSFRFYVTDGQNSSPPESFYIFIKSVDKGRKIYFWNTHVCFGGQKCNAEAQNEQESVPVISLHHNGLFLNA